MIIKKTSDNKNFIISKENKLSTIVRALILIGFGIYLFVTFGFNEDLLLILLMFYAISIFLSVVLINSLIEKISITENNIQKKNLFVNLKWNWSEIKDVKIELVGGALYNCSKKIIEDSDFIFLEKKILLSTNSNYTKKGPRKFLIVIPGHPDLIEFLVNKKIIN